MKILYITHMNEANGSTIALKNIMSEMHRHNIGIGLLCPNKIGFLPDEAQKMGVSIFTIEGGYPPILQYPNVKGLKKTKWTISMYLWHKRIQKEVYAIAKEFKPNIIHCNTSVIDYGLWAAKLLNIPHIWHIREYQDLDFKIKTYPSRHNLLKKMHLKWNYNISITKGIYKHFKMRPCDRVIYDGVIQENIKESQSSEFKFQYILYVGNICEGKGLHILINQFIKFHGQNPEIHLLIVNKINQGDEYYKYCKQLIDTNKCESHIHFIGYRKDVYTLMLSAKALIVPSRFEGFGFIVAEAMYNNCLVIGRNTGGVKEQFDNGLQQTGSEIGLRFTDDNDIAQLLQDAITKDFSIMKSLAKKVVLNNYTTEINANNLLTFYRDVIRNYYEK